MKAWDNLGRTGKRVALVISLCSALGLSGGLVRKIAVTTQEYAYLPQLVALNNQVANARIDSLAKEMMIAGKVDESLHDDLMGLENGYEGL